LDLVAHGLINGHLSSNCRTTRRFGTTTSLEQRPAISTFNATQLSGTLTFRQRPVQSPLGGLEGRSLLTSYLRSRTSNFAR
jgi:hypothetical protein